MKKLRHISLILLSALLLASCGTKEALETTQATPPRETLPAEEIQEEVTVSAENILDKYRKADIGDITILTSNNVNASLFARTAPEEDFTGNLVNDALYERDRMLEAYFQTKVTWQLADEDGNLIGLFQNETVAGDTSFNFMIGPVRWAAVPAFNQSLCLELSSVEDIDLSNPWWTHNVMDNFIYNDRYYMLVGEFSPRNVLSGNMLMFNLAEHKNRGLPSLYDMVREGKWTYDAFNSIIKDIGTDLNGDGQMDYTKDFYGLNCDSTAGLSFYFGMGQNLISAQDDQFASGVNTEQGISVLESIQTLFATNDVNSDSYKRDTYAPNNSFMNNKALFNCMVVLDLSMFRDYETDYGIVPLPKYNEAQASYRSFANVSAMTAVVVSKAIPQETIQDTGLFIEAMTALSHYKSIPEAYEATLLARETRDEDSVEMLRIISEGLMLDLGAVYNIGDLYYMVERCTVEGQPIVSSYQELETLVQADCANLIALFGADE